ncbi:hypothetical protein IWGMT90018_27600 [Mycobacterium kiyosense]|nr:hypothetical protein IWGMT90018_27600 [Mycobacterium kiyosense]
MLSCLVELGSPPPRPDTAYGEWKGGWVDFDGTDLQVGSARADPGPFLAGTGAELALGDSLAFGDFRCRADQAGLFCVNYAHQSAVRFSPTGSSRSDACDRCHRPTAWAWPSTARDSAEELVAIRFGSQQLAALSFSA